MINAKLMRDDGILVISPEGKLNEADFEQLNLLVNPYLEAHGTLNGLLIDVETFPGWKDFASMLSHLRFIQEYENRIKRVAAVTDNGFIAILPNIADFFVSAEVRHFDYQCRDEAQDWLRTGLPSEDN